MGGPIEEGVADAESVAVPTEVAVRVEESAERRGSLTEEGVGGAESVAKSGEESKIRGDAPKPDSPEAELSGGEIKETEGMRTGSDLAQEEETKRC